MAGMVAGFERIFQTYRRRTPRSQALYERATHVLPGGDTRSVTSFAPYPTFIESGEGAEIVDADGNHYLDFLNNYTSLIHGHDHPRVRAAIEEQLSHGMAFAAPNELQTRLAEIILDRVGSVQLIRFCNSGTEAVMTALQAARASTGRQVIAKMEGGYHGSYDYVRVASQLRLSRGAGADEAGGLSAAVGSEVLSLPFNDVSGTARLIRSRGEDVAAIIVEPLLGSSGMIQANDGYLQALRDLADEIGAVLIFDEVMTFRLDRGGYQSLVKVRPDLTVFGKIIGGGLPVGAFGGKTSLMEQFAPAPLGFMTHSGTFNGHPAVMAGGIATLDLLGTEAIARLNALGDQARNGLNAIFTGLGLNAVATGYGSLLDVHFGTTTVSSVHDARNTPLELTAAIHLELMNRGIFIAPRGMMNLSTAAREGELGELLSAWRGTLESLMPVIEEAYPDLAHRQMPSVLAERVH